MLARLEITEPKEAPVIAILSNCYSYQTIANIYKNGIICMENIADEYVPKGLIEESSIVSIPDSVLSNNIKEFEDSLQTVDSSKIDDFKKLKKNFEELKKKGLDMVKFLRLFEERKELIAMVIDSILIPIEYSNVRRCLESPDFYFQLFSVPFDAFDFKSVTSRALFIHSIPIAQVIIGDFKPKRNSDINSGFDESSNMMDALLDRSNSSMNSAIGGTERHPNQAQDYRQQVESIMQMGISNQPLIESALIQSNGDLQTAIEIIFSSQDLENQ
ncbi:MAG: hypothetical protein MHMPM18_001147 [Marteilia pararefringens]